MFHFKHEDCEGMNNSDGVTHIRERILSIF